MARLLTIISLISAALCASSSSSMAAAINVNTAKSSAVEAPPPLLLKEAKQQQQQQQDGIAPASGGPSSSSSSAFPLRALPPISINASTFTISGISAGSAMAVQFEVAFSSIVKAVGTIAGVPYMCAQYGNALAALDCMSSPYMIDKDVLLDYVAAFATAGTIDDPVNLQRHMTMVFSGLSDSVVKQGTVMIIDQMYQDLAVARRYQTYNITAEHSWVTNDYGEACTFLGSPYINDCQYDFGGIFLNRAFDFMGVQPPMQPKGSYNPNNLFKFDQSIFGASPLISMDSVAFAYIPTACQGGKVTCHLHVNFHGCNQQRSAFPTEEDRYVSHTGLNKWAETNNIVVLYPQTIASDLVPLNPQGCFDWWGYTDVMFAQQEGPQMVVIRQMIRAIAGF